ncbi:YgiW/YdeI family stress tolerance OB fold protein [Variovorax paradoxus]|uniref:NirD/YgiW/YdeI family stress tolerance protein n=1 Tax=Variovorax paradoxus TaxID=34073 RepID=A0A6I6HJF2_VARPD|nr:NirD/YgiW/YdeI family stress tolerance protein [Variovorax paradoxus]QGW82994.1 NirD/YgiW/YdeI family stress tolerance protein [Variovorax paradoxus]
MTHTNTRTLKKATLALGMSLALVLPLSPAFAQYAGPSTVQTMTVKQLLDTGKDDQHATLRGFIVSHDGGEHYTFADDTGRMKVEIDAKHFPPGVKIDDKVRVEISGEFDKDLVGNKAELDVKRLSVAAAK